jgi:H+/Cl- antiporter ClcA
LNQQVLPFAGYDALSVARPIDMLAALVMGIMCGIIGLIGFILLAVFGKMGKYLEATIDVLGQGGVFVAMLCKYDPLLFRDGADQLGPIISRGAELGASHVVVTGFLKLLAASISLGFGLVGGQFFPFLFAGTCTGVAINLLFEDFPAVLSVSCCMVAVLSAIMPAIFTTTLLGSIMLALGGAATSAVVLLASCRLLPPVDLGSSNV